MKLKGMNLFLLYLHLLQKEKVVKQPTSHAPRVSLEVKEDDIVIFPSKTPHGTDQT